MTPKEQIGDLLEELHLLKKQQHEPEFLLTFANVELRIHRLRQTLEKGDDYESDRTGKQ